MSWRHRQHHPGCHRYHRGGSPLSFSAAPPSRQDPGERAILARGQLSSARTRRVEWLNLRGRDLPLLPFYRGCVTHTLDHIRSGGWQVSRRREQAQEMGGALEVGALRRLVPHQYAGPPCLSVSFRSAMTRAFLVVVRAAGGVAAPSVARSTIASKYAL